MSAADTPQVFDILARLQLQRSEHAKAQASFERAKQYARTVDELAAICSAAHAAAVQLRALEESAL